MFSPIHASPKETAISLHFIHLLLLLTKKWQCHCTVPFLATSKTIIKFLSSLNSSLLSKEMEISLHFIHLLLLLTKKWQCHCTVPFLATLKTMIKFLSSLNSSLLSKEMEISLHSSPIFTDKEMAMSLYCPFPCYIKNYDKISFFS